MDNVGSGANVAVAEGSVGDHDGVIAEVTVVKESWGCC